MKPQNNLVRMIELADESFHMQDDPEQIQVNAHVLERLKKIHPATLAEKSTRNGPVAWTMVIPTSQRLMQLFIGHKITEREMFRRTRVGQIYDAAYLSSALVLPEYRRRGIALRLVVRSLRSIRREHPIRALFFWPFSGAGEKLAEAVASQLRLPLYKRSK
ncbi:MAG TPA: hypothetical protein VK470_13900 [Bacteroidota bacterium]|nr:hypothetical protein [Bacteroidota bacterium]